MWKMCCDLTMAVLCIAVRSVKPTSWAEAPCPCSSSRLATALMQAGTGTELCERDLRMARSALAPRPCPIGAPVPPRVCAGQRIA